MSTIPASELAAVTPSVLSPSGAALNVIGLMLTNSARVPIGTVQSFTSALAVSNYFGSTSTEADLARFYFAGYDGSPVKPAFLLVAQYNTANVSAFLRGGNISALSLATLQSYNGVFAVTIDGVLATATINLSAATSFSNAAQIIGNGLGIRGAQAAAVTASIGGQFTCTSSGTTLTVSAVLSGSLQPGDLVSGSDGTNSLPGGCTIVQQLTGTPGGTGTYQLSGAATPGNLGSCTVTATSKVLNVTAVGSGTVAVSDVIQGAGITVGTYITSIISGTGGIGLYGISGTAQRVASEAVTVFLPGVLYDSIAGAFVVQSPTTGASSTITYGSSPLATNLLLTQAAGAVLSQGAVAQSSPSAFMNAVIAQTTNWVTFFSTFDPDAGSGNTLKLAFSAWKNTALGGNRFAYICWDTDATPTTTLPATTSLGYLLANNNDSGTCLLNGDPAAGWNATTGAQLAAFVAGAAASIDFSARAGRLTFAFKAQAGFTATVNTQQIADNLGGNPQTALRGNGYNFYGAYASANVGFIWFQRGMVTGPYSWLDSYINQIWLNSALKASMLNLFKNAKSVPYDGTGRALIEAALADPIIGGLTFGAYAPGSISSSQVSAVNQAAGSNVANTLQTQGWFLQILPASSTVRANRQSPPANFWYLDRGSVQALTLNSISVQ